MQSLYESLMSYIQRDPLTELISIIVFITLLVCLLWEFYSLSRAYGSYSVNLSLIQDPRKLAVELSPLKQSTRGIKIIRSLPVFLQSGPERSKIPEVSPEIWHVKQ